MYQEENILNCQAKVMVYSVNAHILILH